MRKFLLAFLFFQLSTVLIGQEYRVFGKCTDKRGTSLDNVKVYSENAEPSLVYTDGKGEYELFFENAGAAEIVFRFSEYEVKRTIIVDKKKDKLKDVKFPFQQQDIVDAQGHREEPFEIDFLPTVDWQNVAMGGIERGLLYTTAATSNNELTTNYNVRGGSYDENLVYVNGFQIYRPFLTRSGQQEGMSFLHTALVESIQFSGGGFDSRYGDKLSSVLDIKYKTPDSLRGSVMASLLGVEAHVEHSPTSRFNFLVGARYRSNGYLLNALPTKGAYNPVFWDAQFLTNYAINEKLTWSLLGHFSSNNYRFKPETAETDFGTANEAFSFVVYFEGEEQTKFQTMMGGTSLKWKPTKKANLDFYLTAFNSVERESFDILGEYYINELETDPSKEEFGDSVAVLGIGSFLSHARNRLDATIINLYHHGDYSFFNGYKDEGRTKFQSHTLKWGVNYQMDYFTDKLSEWKLVDSAGYSIPQSNDPETITLFETIKSDLTLQSQRYTGFFQFNSIWAKNQKNRIVTKSKKYKLPSKEKVLRSFSDTIVESPSRWALSVGGRTGYTTANSEFFFTPRATLKYYPRAYMIKDKEIVRRNLNVHFSTGMYYQPPFYREFRTFDGQLNLDVRAQKSAHFVLGTDVYFGMWGREVPFKFTAEAYYKYMWDVNPFEVDNVRIKYYADNDAVAYAYGLDLNVHGQFVEGIESFFKVGFLSTKEDLLSDFYYDYYNAAGEKIKYGVEDQVVSDSLRVEPGYIPRPTDQHVNFAALIQDRMPNHESFSVQMGLLFGSRLPYGPPDFNHYKDTLRIKSYFRVDLGMSYDFLYKKKEKKNFWNKNFTDAIISFEVFNLLGINNVLSKQWVQDVSGQYYSIPNNLTSRRFNLKLILRY